MEEPFVHQKIGAIDLGTHTCCAVWGHTQSLRPFFTLEGRKAWPVHLEGRGTFSANDLSRLTQALIEARILFEHHGVQRMRCVGTAACRQADNVRVLSDRMKEETGFQLEVLSGWGEGNLIALGCGPFLVEDQPSLVLDIGGGSVELALVTKRTYDVLTEDVLSFPFGLSVGVFAPQETTQHIATWLERHKVRKKVLLYATSGFVGSLWALCHGQRLSKGMATLTRADWQHSLHHIASHTPETLAQNPLIGPWRAPFVHRGSQIFQCLQSAIDFKDVHIVFRHLSDGLLAQIALSHRREAGLL